MGQTKLMRSHSEPRLWVMHIFAVDRTTSVDSGSFFEAVSEYSICCYDVCLQCQYMDDHSVFCETECSSDPRIVVLDATKQQKVMIRDCDKLRTPVKHWWNQADGMSAPVLMGRSKVKLGSVQLKAGSLRSVKCSLTRRFCIAA